MGGVSAIVVEAFEFVSSDRDVVGMRNNGRRKTARSARGYFFFIVSRNSSEFKMTKAHS
jgi:hypothetical protein